MLFKNPFPLTTFAIDALKDKKPPAEDEWTLDVICEKKGPLKAAMRTFLEVLTADKLNALAVGYTANLATTLLGSLITAMAGLVTSIGSAVGAFLLGDAFWGMAGKALDKLKEISPVSIACDQYIGMEFKMDKDGAAKDTLAYSYDKFIGAVVTVPTVPPFSIEGYRVTGYGESCVKH